MSALYREGQKRVLSFALATAGCDPPLARMMVEDVVLSLDKLETIFDYYPKLERRLRKENKWQS